MRGSHVREGAELTGVGVPILAEAPERETMSDGPIQKPGAAIMHNIPKPDSAPSSSSLGSLTPTKGQLRQFLTCHITKTRPHVN
jgi:hypothetical protein